MTLAVFKRIGELFGRRDKAVPEPVEPPPPSLWGRPIPRAEAPLPARARFAHLRTGRGNLLVAGSPRIDMAQSPGYGEALLAMVPEANSALCFLMAQDGRAVDVRADGMVSPAISAYRVQGEGGTLRLRHPLSPNRYLAVTSPGAGAPDGCVIFDGVGRTPFDIFVLEPVDPGILTPETLQLAAEICAGVKRPYRAETLWNLLSMGRIRTELAETLMRILPRDELARLARIVLESEEDCARLRSLLPGNPWAESVLPHLGAWNRQRVRTPPDGVSTSPPSDEFAGDPLEGYGQPQAGFALTALARSHVAPRHNLCLIAAARNEGPYFLEWLAHHRAIGFEHAFIYTNDNWDGSDALLELLAARGVLTLVHNQAGTHCGPQYKAHAHALSLMPDVLDYRWAMLIDLDEYVGFDRRLFADMAEYMGWQETQPVDAVALCWLMFAGSRTDRWEDRFTPERFTRRESTPNQHVKTIFRPQKFWNSQAHYPYATLGAPFVFRTESGSLHHHPGVTDRIPAFAAPPSAQLAWVNHYILRSAPESLWKLARGHGDWKGNTAARHAEMARFVCRTYVSLADKPDLVEDRRILDCAPGLADELAWLRAIPGVGAAEERIKADFASRLDGMVRAFADAVPSAEEPPEFAPFRSLLRDLLASA